MHTFFSLPFDFTVAWYITLFCKQLPLKGHLFFALQLYMVCVRGLLFFVCVLLFVMFSVQLCFCWILCKVCLIVGKCLWISVMNIFPMLDFTFSLYGGLNKMMFLYLLAFFVVCVFLTIYYLLGLFHNISWVCWRWFHWKNCQITCGELWDLLDYWWWEEVGICVYIKWFVISFSIWLRYTYFLGWMWHLDLLLLGWMYVYVKSHMFEHFYDCLSGLVRLSVTVS